MRLKSVADGQQVDIPVPHGNRTVGTREGNMGRKWIHFRPMFPSRVPTVLLPCGTGISTCCPSATLFSLTLGPDFPRADQLYPGDLGYSATRILTLFSLLIPAFSLLSTPQLLPVLLLRVKNAPLPMTMSFPSFGGMF